MDPETSLIVRTATHWQSARDCALVLAAAGIPHEILERDATYVLTVPAPHSSAAIAALAAYDAENQRPRDEPPPLTEYGPSDAGALLALGILGFYAFLIHYAETQRWYARGISSAAHIRIGQLWRVVTALTLHADIAHAVSNAAAAAVFATALARAVGPGVALWTLLLSGAGANLLTAIVRDGDHRALGASGAMFGAVGVLGALQFFRRYRAGVPRRRAWLPIGAAVALLTLLGSEPGTDVVAHAFGFLIGAVIGTTVAVARRAPPRPLAQRVLAVAALIAVAGAWLCALR